MIGKNIGIIGGGPSGLIAAEILSSKGHFVTIYDRMPSLGRKFLMAGRGGLNLTHSEDLESFITRYGSAASWLAAYILTFPPSALRAWCEGLGQETFVGSSKRVFPRSMKATPLLRAWLGRLNEQGVKFALSHNWQGWENNALKFNDNVLVKPDVTLLALGGASWPRLGSDGGWAKILTDSGIELSPFRASNCGFNVEWSEYFSSRFAGTPLKPVTLTHNGVSRQGEAMITASGIEGGAVYALSANLRESVAAKGKSILHLDLRPGMTEAALTQKLSAPRGNQSLSNHLRKAGFPPLVINLLREVMQPEELAKATPTILAARLKALPITITGVAGIARAISTAGGIKQSELTKNLMLIPKPGIFAAGEMLDWEAPTGGYLLQACFSTGVAAAKGIIEYCAD